MAKSISSKFTPIRILILAGIVVLAISAAAWWRLVYSSPANVFDRMLSNSLASPSVTKRTSQADESQGLEQTLALQTSPQATVHTTSVLRQQTAAAETRITTESIGTLEADFVRYTDIKTSQPSPDGKPFNFSDVLNIWGRSDQENTPGGAQLFNQTLLGVVPVASIPQPERSQLLRQIQASNVYSWDSNTVKRQVVNGRPVYTYQVSVLPVSYVSMLKSFARALGMTQLERVDPSQYKDSLPLSFSFDIDVWSGQLRQINYSGSKRSEAFSAYGVRQIIAPPSSSVPVDELQSRLQQLR